MQMKIGRNVDEISLSKKQMFRRVRDKLNEAAAVPGFFEVGEGTPDFDLYCKSNKDGTQIGDCPYAHFLQMVMLKKGIRYTLKPTKSDEKPEWLLQKHNGQMPALVHKDVTLVDSLAIAEYLEQVHPQNSLTRQGAYSYQEVLEKTKNFFPAVSAWIVNKDELKEKSLKAAVEKELDTIDFLVRSTPGHYITGLDVTLADLYLLPQLFHAFVALDFFKDFEFLHLESDATRPALETYLARMMKMEEFNNKKAYVSADKVVGGWKIARGEK
eukprot:gene40411-49247_t